MEIQKNREVKEIRIEIQELLYLIAKIANNHHRNSNFFSKIEFILLHFEKDIKENFLNSEIFNIFKFNKRILLFLLERDFLKIDQFIVEYFEKKII